MCARVLNTWDQAWQGHFGGVMHFGSGGTVASQSESKSKGEYFQALSLFLYLDKWLQFFWPSLSTRVRSWPEKYFIKCGAPFPIHPYYIINILLSQKTHVLLTSNITHRTVFGVHNLIPFDAIERNGDFSLGFLFPFMCKNIHLVIKIKHSKGRKIKVPC